jgi:hypothetical protein
MRKCRGRKTDGAKNLVGGSCTDKMVVVMGGKTA